MIPHSITANSISVLVDNRMRVVPANSINFIPIRDELRLGEKANLKKIRGMLDIPSFIAKVTVGRIRISADEVYFKDEKVGGAAADRLLKHLADGDSIEPLARLLDKLMDNPAVNMRNDLWLWIEAGELPICEDGDIVAFKKVDDDYSSYHADPHGAHIDHSIGAKPSMKRADCDSDRNATCSRGLHFCSYGYLSTYAGDSGHVVILKLNPRDVVAIPSDHNNQKGRACLYEVIGEVPQEEAARFFTGNIVSSVGTYHDESSESPEVDWEIPDEEDGDYDADYDSDATMPDDETSDGFTVVISGKRFNIQSVRDTVESLGQRGAARQMGVARTSLQDALKKLAE